MFIFNLLFLVPTGVYDLKDVGDKWSVADNAYACSSSKFGLTDKSSIEFHNVRVLAFAQLVEDKFPSDQSKSKSVPNKICF
jgi:hypothetical protein